jgi:signal transduction histidine kinase
MNTNQHNQPNRLATYPKRPEMLLLSQQVRLKGNRRNRVLWLGAALMFSGIIVVDQLSVSESLKSSIILVAALGIIISAGGFFLGRQLSSEAENMLRGQALEARQLQESERRIRAIYNLSTTLSSTLNYTKVLEEVQNIGVLALQKPGLESELISAVFLFRSENDMLQVATSRRLTQRDTTKSVPGKEGLLGRALQGGEPVFGGSTEHDPELAFLVAFQSVKSSVAIPLSAGFQNFGVVIFGCREPDAFTDEASDLLIAIGIQSSIALQNAVLYENILGEKDRIVAVEEGARKKLSRDLHDGPTQTITVMTSRIKAIRSMVRSGQTKQADEKLQQIVTLAEKTVKEIRHMLFTMRPLIIEEEGLAAALHEIARRMKDTYDLNVTVTAQPEVDNYLEEIAQVSLFYVVEEAVNNARKHAKATHIQVRLFRREDFIITEIEDDGVGFDVQTTTGEDYHKRGSLGMVSMRERAELANGELLITSRKGRGTKIIIRISIAKQLLGRRQQQELSQDTKPLLAAQETRFGNQIPTVEDVSGRPRYR